MPETEERNEGRVETVAEPVHLGAHEVETLPEWLKVRARMDHNHAVDWLVLPVEDRNGSAVSGRVARTIFQIAEKLSSVLLKSASTFDEQRIDELVRLLAPSAPRSGAQIEIELQNAERRAEYIQRKPLYSASEIHRLAGFESKNKSEPASRWKREGKVFALVHKGADYYPAFQFQDGHPKPAIARILKALPPAFSVWQTAFWFESMNGWLDARTPEECLNDVDAVANAALQLSDPAIG